MKYFTHIEAVSHYFHHTSNVALLPILNYYNPARFLSSVSLERIKLKIKQV